MISVLIYDELDQEKKLIHDMFKEAAAFVTEEKWNIITADKFEEVRFFFEKCLLFDIACMEVTKADIIQILEKMRKKYMDTFLLVISDVSISPMLYIKPSIMPSSLILRPCAEEEINRIIYEMVEAYCNKIQDDQDNNRYFVADTKDGKTYIPHNQIFYFESRAKKIFIRTRSEEYGFYDTMNGLEENLPDYFIRCHRSFIINTRKIQKVFLSQNTIILQDNVEVPLSRSYKPALKEFGRK